MLTGTPPFPREGDGVVLIAHLQDPVPPLEEHGVSAPPELEALLMKALAKDPMDRQQSMAALVAELDAADNSPGRGTMPGRDKATQAASIPGTVVVPEKRARSLTPVAPAAPIAANTTLSRSSGQVTAAAVARQPRRRRSGLAVAGAVAFGVVAAVMVMRAGSRPAPAPPPVAAQTPAVPVPVKPPPVAETPPPPRQTVVELDSDPTGATVRDLAQESAAPLGTTPLRLTFDRAARVLELRLEKRGFRPETLQVDLEQDYTRTVPLRPRPRPVIDPDEARKL
jgi:serine/threonine-protein kinase